MHYFRSLSTLACSIGAVAGCGSSDSSLDSETLVSSTVIDLTDVKSAPKDYEWFDFRPNVKKLILAGAAETEHVAILWYTVPDSGVGPHYHSKTESVYVIDGTQTDAKGTYPTGTIYFNPPGSGHEITMRTRRASRGRRQLGGLRYREPAGRGAGSSVGKLLSYFRGC